MDKIEHELLYLRSEHARMKLKEIGQKLKKSSQRLKYNVSVMQKEGMIHDPFSVIDYSYFGLILFRVYFKGVYISEHDKLQVIQELMNNPFVISVYELTGEFDLTVEFAAPNPSKFNKELKKIAAANPTLNDYKIVLNLVSHIYPRKYLLKDAALQSISSEKIIGGDREQETFNSNEMKVLHELVLSPTIRLADLSKKSGLNVKTVGSIIKQLRKRKVIRSFRYNVNTSKLGISKNRLFLKLHNLSLEREDQLMIYLLKTKEVVQVNKTVGDWDIEIDIESLEATKIRSMIRELREEFKDVIERFNLIEFYMYYKRSYLPMFIFEEKMQ